MAIEKHSRFKDAFQFIAMSCFESGLISAWIEHITAVYKMEGLAWLDSQGSSKLRAKLRKFREEYSKKDEPRILETENFEYVFLFWGAGLLMALVWFAWELGRKLCTKL